MKLEKRFIEIKNLGSVKGELEGYGILWNVESLNERFEKNSIEQDASGVSLYFNHDSNNLLANTKAGTLELKNDEKGLSYKASLPNTQLGEDLKVLIQRGDIQGVSVGFYSEKETREKETRVIQKARLVELSLVDKPFHKTELSMRKLKKRMSRKHWSKLLIGV